MQIALSLSYVGEDLAGMVFVRETVDDGHPTVNGHVVKTVLAEGAHHDQVAHAADHHRQQFA